MDLGYVADVLAGAAPTGSAARGGGARSRGGPARGGGGRGVCSPARGAGAAGRGGAAGAGPSGAPPPDSPHSEPSPRSTAQAAHCAACECWVPRRPGDWAAHVAGIRHRRQALSLRETGERGRLVLSTFEAPPGAGGAAHRLAGRFGAEFGLEPARGGGGDELPRADRAALHSTQTAARLELVSMFGSSGPLYAQAAAALDAQLFANDALRAALNGGGLGALSAAQRAAAALSAPYPRSGAELAGLALTIGALPRGLERPPGAGEDWQPRIVLSACCAGGQLAVWFAGASALLAALARSLGDARGLHVDLRAEQAPLSPALESPGWRRLQAALAALAADTRLARLRVTRPYYRGVGDALSTWEAGGEARAHEAAAGASAAARAALLGALHPRAGRGSLLQIFPPGVFRRVLDEALPPGGCAVEFVFPGGRNFA